MNIDWQGNQRCAGYRREEFAQCPVCKHLPFCLPMCRICGGYGDYPKAQTTNPDTGPGSEGKRDA